MEENILSCPKYVEEAIIIRMHAQVFFAAEWMKPYMGIEFLFYFFARQSLTPQNYFSVYSKETAGEKCTRAHTHTHTHTLKRRKWKLD